MKKITTLLLLIVLSSAAKAQIPSWAVKDSLGYDMNAREHAGMVSLNSKLYILGGYSSIGPCFDFTEYDPTSGVLRKLRNPFMNNGSITEQCLFEVQGKIYLFHSQGIEVYNPSLNTWTAVSYPTGLSLAPDAGFVINDVIYLTLRNSTNFYAYNPVTNTFAPKAARPSGATGRYAYSFELSGKGYWGGFRTYMYDGCSYESGCFDNAFYEYDPTANAWTAKASLPIAVSCASGISLNGKGYVGLGSAYNSITGGNTSSPSWYEYNPLTNSWTVKQNFPGSAANSSISKIGNEIYVFGGKTNETYGFLTDNLYKYLPTNNLWQNVNLEVGQNRTGASGFYANGKIYTGGGKDGEHLTDFWEYDIASNQWSPKANLKSGYELRASAEVNGKGYFVGGVNTYLTSNNFIDSLVEYNPTTNQWTNKTSIPGGKRYGAIALSYNGKLYAGMGSIQYSGYSSDFYRYDPATNNWLALASAPFQPGEGNDLSYFVVGDTAYVITLNYFAKLYKYAFLTNSWDIGTSLSMSMLNSTPTNQGFTFNGKGYYVYGGTSSEQISEYNPQTGTWKQFTGVPFSNRGKIVIPTPNEVYFGFGTSSYINNNKNTLQALRFNANISAQVGVFTPTQYNEQCGTGTINANMINTVHDTLGNLFTSFQVQSGSSYSVSPVCYSVNSRDTLLPYYQGCGNFGSGNVNAMFMKKSIVLSGNSGPLPLEMSIKFFYTTSELNQFVQAFNFQNGTTKTINDIRIVRSPMGAADFNPINNFGASPYYEFYNPNFQSYANGKFAEIFPTSYGSFTGEFYAVLTSPLERTITTTSCGAFTYNNQAYAASGTYSQLVSNGPGCDSTITINLTVNNTFTSNNPQTICQGQSYSIDGSTYSSAGSYINVLQASNGCDSTVTTILTVNPSFSVNNPQTICQGENYSIGANSYTTSGTYTNMFQTLNGCDSLVTTVLTVRPTYITNNPQTICQGETYTIGANTYSNSGTYVNLLQSIYGCDSTITTVLNVLPTYTISNPQTICQGESYTINGNTYTTTGTHSDVFQSINGCDSTVITNLTVRPTYNVDNPQSICEGESYTVGGNTYSSAGNYTDVLQSINGCDSTVNTVLTITNVQINLNVTASGLTISSAQNAGSYQWINCANNAPISGANSQNYTATVNGSYAVILTECGVSDTSNCVVINDVGLDENNLNFNVQLYPNPTEDILTIEVFGTNLQQLIVTDLNGKILSKQHAFGNTNSLNVKNLSAGVYLVNIETENGVLVRRFVKR
jgi:hypothetical protein